MHKHNTQIMVQVRNMVNTTQNSKLNRIKRVIISEMQLTVYMSTVIHDVQQHKNLYCYNLTIIWGYGGKNYHYKPPSQSIQNQSKGKYCQRIVQCIIAPSLSTAGGIITATGTLSALFIFCSCRGKANQFI